MPVSDPAGTLYIDIANHGLEGTYANVGAATWVRSVLNGRSIILEEDEWLITVVDFRNSEQGGHISIFQFKKSSPET